MSVSTENLILFLLVGTAAGWLAGTLMRGSGFGILGDMLVGVVGALIGAWIFGLLGVSAFGMIGVLLTALVGALLLLFAVRVVRTA